MAKKYLVKIINFLFYFAIIAVIGTTIYNSYIVISDALNDNVIYNTGYDALLGVLDETTRLQYIALNEQHKIIFKYCEVINSIAIVLILAKMLVWVDIREKRKDNNVQPYPVSLAEESPVGLFSFNGRMDRTEYVKLSVAIILGQTAISLYLLELSAMGVGVFAFLILEVLLIAAFVPITVRRLHDTNNSGWSILLLVFSSILNACGHSMHQAAALFLLVPQSSVQYILSLLGALWSLGFLYLVYQKGESEENKYGIPKPLKKYKERTINALCICIGLGGVFGLVGYIAM